VNTDSDDHVCSDKDILDECESFYQNLYNFKVVTDNAETDCFFTQQAKEKCLNKNEKLFCEGLLKRKERLDALESMKSGKSPGTDGVPSEFYKVFWNDLAEILINSLNYSYEIGKLSISQRRKIIKLIPKKGC